MSKPWRLLDDAERELEEACKWYDRERPGLGGHLADVVSRAIASLATTPTTASPVMKNIKSKSVVRRQRIARFPYAIVFMELEHEVLVVAIAHLRARPNYWTRRLRAT